MEIRYSENDGTCTFFDQEFTLGTHDGSAEIERLSGDTPTVKVAAPPPRRRGMVTLNITFEEAGEAHLTTT